MKKKILFVIFLLLIGIPHVKATTITDQFTSKFIGKYHYVDSEGKFGDFEFFQRKDDGRVAYCIEPGIPRSDEMYEGYYGLSQAELASKVGLTEEKLKEISLIAYYGYGYQNHTSEEWIVATQAKIWEVLGRNFQWTSRNSKDNPWAYVIPRPQIITDLTNELDSLIARHKKVPSYTNKHIVIPYGEDYVLKDTNEITVDYQLSAMSGAHVEKEENNLIITPHSSSSSGQVALRRKNLAWQGEFIVYHHDVGQDLLLSGNLEDEVISFYFRTVIGRVKIEKKDKDTNTCQASGDASLNGAQYSLYRADGTLVQTITLYNCTATISNLGLGKYYFQEAKAPEGYELDNTKYFFEITEQNISSMQTIKVSDEVYKTRLEIDKKYLTEEGLKPEANATFVILKKETLEEVTTFKTDQDGKYAITLPYGEYIIRQLSGLENYYISEDVLVKVNAKSDEVTNISLVNEPYTSKVHLVKLDEETKKPLKMAGIAFKIYDVNKEKYVCQNEECLFKTNEDGEFLTEALFPSTYRLEEVKTNIPGYFWNEETIVFTVDKNSKSIIELSFTNKKIKGEVLLKKEDDSQKPLANVVFSLYANEDIFENGKIVYYQNEEIGNYTTDKNGEIRISNLPLGNYYFIETNPLEGFVSDDEPIHFALLYENSLMETVFKKVKVVNEKLIHGEVTLYKNDQDGNPLKEVVFSLYASEDILENGQVVYHQKEKIGDFKTNQDGMIHITNLPLGKYYLIEKSSLDGFIPLDEPILFEINKEETLLELTVVNEKYFVPETHLDNPEIIKVYSFNDEKREKNSSLINYRR